MSHFHKDMRIVFSIRRNPFDFIQHNGHTIFTSLSIINIYTVNVFGIVLCWCVMPFHVQLQVAVGTEEKVICKGELNSGKKDEYSTKL